MSRGNLRFPLDITYHGCPQNYMGRYIEGYKIEVVFENGKKGVVDFENYITRGGIFSRFADIEYFKQYFINKELGVLCWPDDLYIAPEALYLESTGEPLPDGKILKNNYVLR